MSTITDALKKREKEVGQEEVQEIVPVSLDEPDVTVPKDRSARRIVGLAGVLLIVGGVAIIAMMLYNELWGGKSTDGTGAQIASLRKPEGQNVPVEGVENEALPSPEAVPEPPVTPAGIGSESPEARAPEVVPSGPVEVSPPEMGVERTAEAGATTAGVQGIVPETPIELPPDPFAGITLQGIMRFDPTSPEALISGKSLKVGDSINGIEVVEIGDESVKLRFGSIERVISYE